MGVTASNEYEVPKGHDSGPEPESTKGHDGGPAAEKEPTGDTVTSNEVAQEQAQEAVAAGDVSPEPGDLVGTVDTTQAGVGPEDAGDVSAVDLAPSADEDDEDYGDPAEYDPAANTVPHVLGFAKKHPDHAKRVFDAESEADEPRVGITEALDPEKPANFHPGDHGIQEVNDFVEANPGERERVASEEAAGQNRKGLAHLQEAPAE